MKREIEYGDYQVFYEIEGDVDGPIANITAAIDPTGRNAIYGIDNDIMVDIKSHCIEDFYSRQIDAYMRTGEIISD